MGGQRLRGLRARRRGCCSRSRPGTAPNILRTSRKLGLRSEASTRFEKQLHPELAIAGAAGRLAADGRALRRPARARHDRRRGRAARHGAVRAARRAAARRAARAWRSRPTAPPHTWSGSGSRCDVNGRRHRHRVPADRHFDVTREADLIEEVGRVHGLDEHLPATLPGRRRQGGGLTPRAGRCGGAPRTCCATPASTRSSPELHRSRVPGRLRLPRTTSGEPIGVSQPAVGGAVGDAHRRCSAACSAPPRHNLARGAERVALFESGRVYLPARRRPRAGDSGWRFAGIRPSPVAEPHRIGVAPDRRAGSRGLAGPAPPARLLRRQGHRRAARVGTRPAGGVRAGGQPFLHPARAARDQHRRQARRLGRRAPPAVLAGIGTPAGGRRIRARPRPLFADVAVGRETYEDVTTFPAVAAGHRRGRQTRQSRGTRSRSTIVAAGGDLLASAAVFDVYGRAGRRRQAQEPGAAARVPSLRPDADRRGGRGACGRRSSPPWRRSGRGSVAEGHQPLAGEPAARVLVAGASGFAGALAAELVWHHPRLELARGDLAIAIQACGSATSTRATAPPSR